MSDEGAPVPKVPSSDPSMDAIATAFMLRELVVEQMISDSGFTPTELETLTSRMQREREGVAERLDQAAAQAIAGLDILMETGPENVAAVARQCRDTLADPETHLAQAISDQAGADAIIAALPAVVDACRDLLTDGDFERAKTAACALCILYPEAPHPYVLSGTALWQTDGLAAALQHYEAVLAVIEHPMINFFAADVFLESGDRARCIAVLKSGLALAEEDDGDSAEFKPQLEEFLAELEG